MAFSVPGGVLAFAAFHGLIWGMVGQMQVPATKLGT